MALTVKIPTGRSVPAPDTAGRCRCSSHCRCSGASVAPGGELRPLTGLRIVAAVWVVAFHFHFTGLPGVAEVSALLGPLVTQGALGVDLFFVLSGFVIAYTYLDVLGPRLRAREAGRFVLARAGRMWPAYLLVFNLFGVWLTARAVLGSGSDIAFQAVQPVLGAGEWLRQVFLVQVWDRPYLDGASWVGPTWSISAEWLAYLLFPLSALLFFRLRRLPVLVLALGALALMSPMAASFVLIGSPYYPFSWLVRVVCGFSAGVLTLLVVRRLRSGSGGGTAARADERTRRTASVLAGVTIAGVVAGLLASVVLGAAAVGAVTLLFPVLVGALALADRGPARLLASRPMVHGGRISYALYLVHIPMFEVLWLALRHYGGGAGLLAAGSLSAHLAALAVLAATVPAAHLLFTFVEQPARRRMRDLPGARRRAGSVPDRPDTAGPAPERIDSGLARLDPLTALIPRPVAAVPERVDSGRARLDPPTIRLPRQARPGPSTAPGRTAPQPRRPEEAPAPEVPVLEVPVLEVPVLDVPVPDVPVLDGPVPAQQLGTAEWVLARISAAREAGHGDDREGDGLAGNLMAAARLRSTVPGPGAEDLFVPAGRVERVRAVQERTEATVARSAVAQPVAAPCPIRAVETVATSEPAQDARAVPAPRVDHTGSRTGVERCGRRGRHSAHGSAATPIVATAAASVRRRRRPTHGAHHRDG